jgi:hypothetical protein
LAARRRQSIEAPQAERRRLDQAALPGVRGSLGAIIAARQTSLSAIEDEIAATIADAPPLAS